MAADDYRPQVELLLDVLPLIMAEPGFALKGGTAINLFIWDMPRLSIDIDLTWLPNESRAESLAAIGAALARVKAAIEQRLPSTRVIQPRQGAEGMEVKLHCQRIRAQVKIEVNPVLRGNLMPVRQMACSQSVQDQFEAYVEANVLAHGELFGGKICAALDRQHPRDLFDVKQLLDRHGLTAEVRLGFVAGLVSHGRPIAELLTPVRRDQRATFETQFRGMARIPFTYADHEASFDRLLAAIHTVLTADDRAFLQSFEAGEPDWDRFPLRRLSEMPGPQFKLMNIAKFRQAQPARYAQGLEALEAALR